MNLDTIGQKLVEIELRLSEIGSRQQEHSNDIKVLAARIGANELSHMQAKTIVKVLAWGIGSLIALGGTIAGVLAS